MVNLFYAVNSITWIGGWNSSTMNDWVRGSWGCGYYWYIFEGNVEKFAEELYMSIQFVYTHYTCLFIKSMLTSLSSIGDLYTLLCFLKNECLPHYLQLVTFTPYSAFLKMHTNIFSTESSEMMRSIRSFGDALKPLYLRHSFTCSSHVQLLSK